MYPILARLTLTLLAFSLLLLGRDAAARTLHVPQDYQTIQAAVDDCEDGDSIVVGPGRYAHFSVIGKNGLTFIGAGLDADQHTIVTGINGNSDVVAMYIAASQGIEISGFEVTTGYTGVWFHRSTESWFHHNYIHDNPTGWASSISADDCQGLLIERNVMLRANHYGLYLVWATSNVVVRHNVIGWTSNNDGIHLDGTSDIQIYNNIICNVRDYGVFLYNENDRITIGYNDLYQNVRLSNVQLNQSNIQADPRFVNVNGNDYHLTENSPCIDAGDPNSPRDPDGTRADIGCYFFGTPFQLIVEPDSLDFGYVTYDNPIQLPIQIVYECEGDLPDLSVRFRPVGDLAEFVYPEQAAFDIACHDTLREFVELGIGPDAIEPGEHTCTLEFFTRDNENTIATLTVRAYVVPGFGFVTGTITDFVSGDPIEGAEVRMSGLQQVFTSTADGHYGGDPIPAWTYTVEVSHPDFQTWTSDEIEVQPNSDVQLDVQLRYALCQARPEAVTATLRLNDSLAREVTIQNRGSGPLHFNVQRRFPALVGIDQWDVRSIIPVEEASGDNRIQGIEFVGDRFVVTGGNSGRGRGKVWLFDHDGRMTGSFDQFMDSQFGMRDLAWDGELIWGGDGWTVSGFTPDGELVHQFNGPITPSRAFAWDDQRELLWISDITTSVYGVDREGNVITRLQRPGPRIYSLAWYPEDPDGACLYMLTSTPEQLAAAQKLNVETGELIFLADLPIPASGVCGCAITREWDPLSWTLIGIVKADPTQGEQFDRAAIFQIADRTDWMQVSPTEGSVEAGSEENLTVTLASTGLPEGSYDAVIVVTHNGRGDNLELPIEMIVQNRGEIEERQLRFQRGINLVSLNVIPLEPDIRTMFQPLVDQNQLRWVKDQSGRFYNPAIGGFCNIPGWTTGQAYLTSVNSSCSFTVTGEVIPPDQPIPLLRGWQTAAYYLRQPSPAQIAIADIEDDVILMKDAIGRFYWPSRDFCNLEDLTEGQGYRILTARPCELVWQPAGRAANKSTPTIEPNHFIAPEATGKDMSLLVLVDDLPAEEIAVYTGGLLVGAGVINDGRCGIAVRGSVEDFIAANDGDPLDFRLFDGTIERAVEATMIEGESTYKTDSFAILQLRTASSANPSVFQLYPANPNPFNSSTTFSYDIPKDGMVSLTITDLTGRVVARLVSGRQVVGSYRFVWRAGAMPAGIYLARLTTDEFEAAERVILLR